MSTDGVAFEMDTLHISRDFKITHVSVVAALKEAHLGKDVVQHTSFLSHPGETDFNSPENGLTGDYTAPPSSSLNCYITLTVNSCKVKCKSKHF